MGTSIYLSRFLTLVLCVIFPLYIALRGTASVSDTALLFSSLSQRAEAVHFALTSPLVAAPAPISEEAKGRRRKRYPSLPDGLAHSINSFEQYAFLAEKIFQRKHARYAKQTPAQKAISNKLGYPTHFQKARKAVEINARLVEQIAQIARADYHTASRALEDEEDAEFGLVDLAFAHLSRDWSTQGAKERQAVFPPVLDGLARNFGENGRGKKVLVPGSGMGRLASDIADLGMSPLLH